jgi:hypothetical protein
MIKRESATTRRALTTVFLSLAVVCAGHSASLAGSCTNTTRKMEFFGTWNPKAHTSVHNETKTMTLLVEIYRGSSIKKSQYIKPGEDVSDLTKFAESSGGGKIRAAITPTAGATTTADCTYRIRYDNQSGKMTWELLKDQTAVCDVGNDIRIVCQKSFNKDKLRYNTSLRVRDPK